MALVVKRTETLEYPEEPGTWFKIVVPLSASDIAEMGSPTNLAQVQMAGLIRALKDWSYSEALTTENIGLLDGKTFSWLATEIFERSGVPELEKKDSSSNSSPTTDQDAEPTPASSAI